MTAEVSGGPMEALPEALRAELGRRFPAYHVPGPADLVEGWIPESDHAEPAFACRGDFNGDGRQEIATFLLAPDRWRLVAAHHDGGSYIIHSLDRFPGRDEIFTRENPPQRFRLWTLNAGSALVVEGSDYDRSRHQFDSIVLTLSAPSGSMQYRWRDRRRAYVASAFGSLTD